MQQEYYYSSCIMREATILNSCLAHAHNSFPTLKRTSFAQTGTYPSSWVGFIEGCEYTISFYIIILFLSLRIALLYIIILFFPINLLCTCTCAPFRRAFRAAHGLWFRYGVTTKSPMLCSCMISGMLRIWKSASLPKEPGSSPLY